ncbi:MAG TPA: hypothetical protein VGG14_05905 [Candidatus Sulfotelmatobacter sp.]|jgi:hypothetical protein
MKASTKLFATALTVGVLTLGLWAEDPSSAAAAKDAAATPAASPAPAIITAADLQALKDALAAQQLQLQRLEQQLQRQQEQQAAAAAASKAEEKTVLQDQVAGLSTGIPTGIQPAAAQSPAQNLQETAPTPDTSPIEGPLTIHFRGINITPGGYVAAEFVRRSRALSADLPTPFNSVTMPGASQSQLSEFFGSARQSKITTFVNGKVKNVDLSSYVSADFLSAGVTSTSTSTNSYTLRLRQAWAQAKFDSGWSFLGGQMWSLATENGRSISPDDDLGRTNDSRPKTIDPSYNVGFVFTRQYGIRLTKTFGDKVAFAVAMENAQGTLTTHGNGDNFLLGNAGASNSYNSTSTYTFNPSPDLLAKVALDPGFGHYEIFGLFDRFTGRIFPCGEVALATGATAGPCPSGVGTGPNATGAYNDSRNGGGFGASGRWNIAHRVMFGVKGFGGSGVGRYGPAGLPDVSINGDGSLHEVKNLMGLTTLEIQTTKKLSLDFYGGTEYAGRAASFDPISGKAVGYGAPQFNNSGCYTELPPTVNTGFTPTSLSNCAADTRALIEGTAAAWYRFYNGPRGRFQFGVQYSYLTRQTWSGVGFAGKTGSGVSPEGVDNMIFTSFRYYLP